MPTKMILIILTLGLFLFSGSWIAPIVSTTQNEGGQSAEDPSGTIFQTASCAERRQLYYDPENDMIVEVYANGMITDYWMPATDSDRQELPMFDREAFLGEWSGMGGDEDVEQDYIDDGTDDYIDSTSAGGGHIVTDRGHTRLDTQTGEIITTDEDAAGNDKDAGGEEGALSKFRKRLD
ncbi:MAG: hypothetical protein JW732_10200 [Dehalococcoidia bacterium]|nr:hypothetical protein [Dehalococcoidia bacterium]